MLLKVAYLVIICRCSPSRQAAAARFESYNTSRRKQAPLRSTASATSNTSNRYISIFSCFGIINAYLSIYFVPFVYLLLKTNTVSLSDHNSYLVSKTYHRYVCFGGQRFLAFYWTNRFFKFKLALARSYRNTKIDGKLCYMSMLLSAIGRFRIIQVIYLLTGYFLYGWRFLKKRREFLGFQKNQNVYGQHWSLANATFRQ